MTSEDSRGHLGRLVLATLAGFFALVFTVIGGAMTTDKLKKSGYLSWIDFSTMMSLIMGGAFAVAIGVVLLVMKEKGKSVAPTLQPEQAAAADLLLASATRAPSPEQPEGAGTEEERASDTDDLVTPKALRVALEIPQKSVDSSALLLLTAVAFMALQLGSAKVLDVAVLMGIIFFHELGHYAAMRGFGYRDVKIFFLPLFGGATSGKREGAPAWQRALVSLMGPLPGLVLGVALILAGGQVEVAGQQMLLINAFNLLPFEPLDGGHFMAEVVFSRWRRLELVFAAAGLLALVALSITGEMWLLLGLSLMRLVGLSARGKLIQNAEELRGRWPGWPERLADASDEMLRDALGRARAAFESEADPGKRALRAVSAVSALHERVLMKAPGAAIALGLLFVYGAAWFVALVGVVALVLRGPRP